MKYSKILLLTVLVCGCGKFKPTNNFDLKVVKNGCGKYAIQSWEHIWTRGDDVVDTARQYCGIFPDINGIVGGTGGVISFSYHKKGDTIWSATLGWELMFNTEKEAVACMNRKIAAEKEEKRIADSTKLCHTYH